MLFAKKAALYLALVSSVEHQFVAADHSIVSYPLS